MSAKNAAGIVGKFGTANYTSLSRNISGSSQMSSRGASKFFKSRLQVAVTEDIIEEEEEEDEEEEGVQEEEEEADKENISANISNQSLNFNTTSSTSGSHLQVAVRVRPLHSEENEGEVLVDANQIVFRGRVSRYDAVLGTEVQQEEVYDRVVRPQVEQLVQRDGCNAVVFAYGPTGTGKTHTMGMGDNVGEKGADIGDGRGVLPRALAQLLAHLDTNSQVRLSFYEILKDETMARPCVCDLFTESRSQIPVRLDKAQEAIPSLTEVSVTRLEHALQTVGEGVRRRRTEATKLNLKSSRSHAVLVITYVCDGISRRLSLVDLAGSESALRTQASGTRRAEGVGINESLLHLGNVIRALAKKEKHVPHRSTPLTWVLRDSLTPQCLISMVFCISPADADGQETNFTLKFAEEAKRMKVQPVAAHLLPPRNTPGMCVRTPGSTTNNTINMPTSSTKRKRAAYSLNRTIGTPGKRARGEDALMTPLRRSGRDLTSTVDRRGAPRGRRQDNALLDISGFNNVSAIGAPQEEDGSTVVGGVTPSVTQRTVSEHEFSSLIEPMMRQMTETMAATVGTLMTEHMEKMTQMMSSRAARTPQRAMRPIDECESLEPTVIEVCKLPEQSQPEEDNIIAGANLPQQMAEEEEEDIIMGSNQTQQVASPTNRRLAAVTESASPVLAAYSSPTSTSSAATSAVTAAVTASPTVEEMEKLLGINAESPGAIDLFDSNAASTSRMKGPSSRKSSRRTTMLSSEIRDTLADIRNMAAANPNRRRSTRLGNKALVSPTSDSSLEKENSANGGSGGFKHPLMVGEAWKVAAGRQHTHNNNILVLINTANVSMLTKLPAVGPKSALLINQYRDLHDGIKTLEEIKNIPGLNKKFFDKFCLRNQIVLGDGK